MDRSSFLKALLSTSNMTYDTILSCTNHCHSQLMCCPPNLVDNSTTALPLLHHQMMLMKMEWLELHTLGMYITSLQFQAKCTCLRNQRKQSVHFPETVGQEEFLRKEIYCCSHHKITIFIPTDTDLGLNLVIGITFVKMNFTKLIFL